MCGGLILSTCTGSVCVYFHLKVTFDYAGGDAVNESAPLGSSTVEGAAVSGDGGGGNSLSGCPCLCGAQHCRGFLPSTNI